MKRLFEDVIINGKSYEDTYGEDISDPKRQVVTVDGIKKQVYPVKKKDGSYRNYIKLRKFEPIQALSDDVIHNDSNKKFTAYKQFKTLYNPDDPSTYKYKGLLFPLFVGDTGKPEDGIRVGRWYKCGVGELKIAVDDNGIPIEGSSLQVGSKLGNLSYRPGWHLASIPLTRHIGKDKGPNGEKKWVKEKIKKDGTVVPSHWKDIEDYHSTCSQYVWCEVEYSAHYDFTDKAYEINNLAKVKKNSKKAYFTDKKDFENGFYHYKTNSNASNDEDWLIADSIRVIKVLTDDEVKDIVGDKAQSRWIADGSENCKFMADFEQFKENIRESNNISKKIFEEVDILNNALNEYSKNWVENKVGAEIIGDGIYLYVLMIPYGNPTDYRTDIQGLSFMRNISKNIGGAWMFQKPDSNEYIKASWFFKNTFAHSNSLEEYNNFKEIINKILDIIR